MNVTVPLRIWFLLSLGPGKMTMTDSKQWLNKISDDWSLTTNIIIIIIIMVTYWSNSLPNYYCVQELLTVGCKKLVTLFLTFCSAATTSEQLTTEYQLANIEEYVIYTHMSYIYKYISIYSSTVSMSVLSTLTCFW